MAVKPFNVASLTTKAAVFMDPKKVGYQDSIDIISDELHKTRKSFIKVGWYLKHINEENMYREDGYSNIYEFAYDKFNISQTTATRFINSCIEYSVNHDSPELDEKYMDYSVSQLFEMLPMKAEEKEQITPEMTVKEIREIKKESRAEVTEPDDEEIKYFYNARLERISKDDRKNLKDYLIDIYGKPHCVYCGDKLDFECTPRGIKINSADEITWTRFVNRINELFPITEEQEAMSEPTDTSETPTDDNIPGQTSIEKDFPEYMPDSENKEPLPEQRKETVIDGEYREIKEVEKELLKPYQKKCITGWSKYGVCTCCGCNGVTCCAQCQESCNSRCGWINEPCRPEELRDEIEKLAEEVGEVFWRCGEWKDGKWKKLEIPQTELEIAKENCLKLAAAIEKFMEIT